MNTKPSYDELAMAIATCVHSRMYLPEKQVDGTVINNVDNMCSSAYQIPSGVLNRLDILVPLDDLARRNNFTCKPDEFSAKITQNKDRGCSYETLVLALICLLELYPDETGVLDCLVRLEVCETYDQIHRKTKNSNPQIPWLEMHKYYSGLFNKWPELLKS